MPEITTPTVDPTASAPAQIDTPAKKPPVKRRNVRKTRNTIITVIVLAALAVGGFFLFRFLTAKDESLTTIQTAPADLSSIQSKVSGSGNAKAKESAAITLTAGGTVKDVFVTAGDKVTAGQPLYTISSQVAEDAVVLAREKVDSLMKDLKDLNKQASNLTVRAPFDGKLLEVGSFTVDQSITSGTAVATLVNDKKLKLSLYFSYAYEKQIKVGQTVNVSIPSVMGPFTGKVEKINKVSFVSPEGAVHFEVVVVFDNPGTLTEKMAASATMTAADGSLIYPYDNAQTQYYESRKLVTEAAGPLLSYNLLNYANVTAGQVLMTLGSDTIDSEIRAKQKEIADAQTKLEEAQKALSNFNAVAPIDGTVTTCTLHPGATVKSGETVIIISNTTTMLVTITVDDRNISFVKPGMSVDLTDWNGNVFAGTVTSINTGSAESANGMTSFPVTLTVDNAAGTLLEGVWLDYSFVASQSDNCIVVPMQAVKYVSDAEGNTFSVVFIKAEAKPENVAAIEIPPVEPGQTPKYPAETDGFYPVPVTTGLSDNYNVEVKDGLQGGEEVFLNYYVEQSFN